jgi:hypothetical protein
VLIALLAVPMAVGVLAPDAIVSETEARLLAPAPALPRTAAEWRALPRALDHYLGDHFGLRSSLVRLEARWRYAVVLPLDLRVVIGKDGQLFLNGDASIEQSTGRLMRRERILAFADGAAEFEKRLAAAGGRLLVAIPPNSASILGASLPAWAAPAPRAVSEYDTMLAALAARGVAAVDLRLALRMANAAKPVYRRTDTHWNRFGALVAYNAVVTAAGHGDWTIDPARAFKGFARVPGGDLARLLDVSADISDEEAIIDLSSYAPPTAKLSAIDTEFESGGDLVETGRPGPTVLVIGDSFTRQFWQDNFALHVARYVWLHHEQCGFKPGVVAQFHPDLVVLAPTERMAFCAGTPKNSEGDGEPVR